MAAQPPAVRTAGHVQAQIRTALIDPAPPAVRRRPELRDLCELAGELARPERDGQLHRIGPRDDPGLTFGDWHAVHVHPVHETGEWLEPIPQHGTVPRP